jgi:hypothetical protein
MKLRDVTTATNPISGQKISLFDIGGLLSLILGALMLIFVTATAQNLARKVERAVPRVDMTVDSFGQAPKPAPGKIRL